MTYVEPLIDKINKFIWDLTQSTNLSYDLILIIGGSVLLFLLVLLGLWIKIKRRKKKYLRLLNNGKNELVKIQSHSVFTVLSTMSFDLLSNEQYTVILKRWETSIKQLKEDEVHSFSSLINVLESLYKQKKYKQFNDMKDLIDSDIRSITYKLDILFNEISEYLNTEVSNDNLLVKYEEIVEELIQEYAEKQESFYQVKDKMDLFLKEITFNLGKYQHLFKDNEHGNLTEFTKDVTMKIEKLNSIVKEAPKVLEYFSVEVKPRLDMFDTYVDVITKNYHSLIADFMVKYQNQKQIVAEVEEKINNLDFNFVDFEFQMQEVINFLDNSEYMLEHYYQDINYIETTIANGENEIISIVEKNENLQNHFDSMGDYYYVDEESVEKLDSSVKLVEILKDDIQNIKNKYHNKAKSLDLIKAEATDINETIKSISTQLEQLYSEYNLMKDSESKIQTDITFIQNIIHASRRLIVNANLVEYDNIQEKYKILNDDLNKIYEISKQKSINLLQLSSLVETSKLEVETTVAEINKIAHNVLFAEHAFMFICRYNQDKEIHEVELQILEELIMNKEYDEALDRSLKFLEINNYKSIDLLTQTFKERYGHLLI